MSEAPALRVLSGDREGELLLIHDEMVVGRAPGCDVRILDPRVSRRHARFSYGEGVLILEDLGSQNGTVVNSARVRQVQLRHGDLIRVGRVRFQICRSNPNGAAAVHMIEETPTARRVVRRFEPDNLSRPSNMPLDSWFREIGAAGDDSDVARLPWLRSQTRNYAVLFEVSQRVQQMSDTSAMLRSVLEFLVGVLRADRAVLALVDDSPDRLRPETVVYGAHAAPDAVIAMSRTIAKQVVEGRCGVISHDARADQRFGASESIMATPTRSLLAVPLPAGAKVLGLIELSCTVPGDQFTEGELELMQVVAIMLASALHRRELAEDQAHNIQRLEENRQRLLEQEKMLLRSGQLAKLGRLTHQMVHEMSNHLSPLKFATILRELYPDDDYVDEHVRMQLETANALERMLDDIKQQVAQGDSNTLKAPGKLSGPARSAERFLRYDEVVRNHRMELVVDADPIVEMDEALLRSVVVNLVRNAGQAIKHTNGHVIIRVDQQGSEAVLSVEDNGSGIPDAVALRVFEPMFTTKGAGGSGVGLHIAKNTVEAHGGTLTFATREGRGTTFTFRMPVITSPPDEPTSSGTLNPKLNLGGYAKPEQTDAFPAPDVRDTATASDDIPNV